MGYGGLRKFAGGSRRNNRLGEKQLDIVTLFRYTTGTVKNCDSGRAPSGATGPKPFWEWRWRARTTSWWSKERLG